jgi:hypothetical protein
MKFTGFWLVILSLLIGSQAVAQPGQIALAGTYHGKGFAVSYPKGWTESGAEPFVSLAPANARTKTKSGKDWIAEGIYVGLTPSSSVSLEETVSDLFKIFKDTHMVRVGGSKPLEVTGHPGIVAEFSNTDPDAPAPESGLIAGIKGDTGQVIYLILFCPTSKKNTSFPIYQRIIGNIAFDRASPVQASNGQKETFGHAALDFITEHFTHCGDSYYMADYAQTMWMGVRQFKDLDWQTETLSVSETDKLNGITEKGRITLSATAHRMHPRSGSWTDWKPGFSTFSTDLENNTGIGSGKVTIEAVHRSGAWTFQAPLDITNSKQQPCSYFNQPSLK